ncbi:hypothetical protein [Microbacterium aurantiacum]|uniref:MinD-like ATPase involved in chromosome partitioning or flagellar assembly n=1 Tax=Microbacterium aurantiacum TaxID=162393 RepID=A0ABT8FUN6_9MICO|nr:hypothetical protein [Microbacterium aurantiacum]MDN4464930.1 hypothetical protein [Microbacterium aurantiacum]
MSLDVRALPAALFGSAAAERARVTGWHREIATELPTTRRIGFISLAPGTGTSTLAHRVTGILASRRSEPILAVDLSSGARSLGARLGADPTSPDDTRAGARTSDDARTGLPSGDGWFAVRPAPHDATDAEEPAAAESWLSEVAPIARFFEVTVTDFGVRHPLVDLATCAALCDVVCLVADAGRTATELARAVAPAIVSLPERPGVVLALVDHARAGDAVARAVDGDPAVTVAIPFDGGLQADAAPRTRPAERALLRLTAALMAASASEVAA